MIIHKRNTNENIEVEIRAILEESQAKILFKRLEAGEGKYMGEEKLIDLYFCRNEVKEFSEIEMNEVGSYSLRLREKEKEGKKEIYLNIKVITNYGDHNAWEEHETDIGSLEESYLIFKAIGFKPFFRLKKTRKSFYIEEKKMTVNMEYIEDFGVATEIEIITSQENAENSKQIIKDFLANVGVRQDQIVPKSITNILMNKMAKFDGTIAV